MPRRSRGCSSTSNGTSASGGGSVGARLDLGRGWARLDGYYENGYGGLRAGIDLPARVRLWGDSLGIRAGSVFAEGRLSYASFRDDSRPIDHADSFGLQAGVRWTPLDGITVHGLVEENVNRFYPSQLRAVGAARSVVLGRHETARHPPPATVERPVSERTEQS